MLPICLVLLLATSALAAPSIRLDVQNYNEVAPPKNNGRLVSGFVTGRAFGIVDGGETNTYTLTVESILNDLANSPDPRSQAMALGQALAILSQLAPGTPGNACAAANVINAVSSGNNAGVRSAVVNFVETLAGSVDQIVQLATNPEAARYAVGPRGNCVGGGRTYNFEAAWDVIRATASPAQDVFLNDQYCIAKRLFDGNNVESNNIGAFLTAVSLPPVVEVFEGAFEPLARFLGAIGNGNSHAYAGAVKQALVNAL